VTRRRATTEAYDVRATGWKLSGRVVSVESLFIVSDLHYLVPSRAAPRVRLVRTSPFSPSPALAYSVLLLPPSICFDELVTLSRASLVDFFCSPYLSR
jgi:hypothetical protein